MPQPYKYAVLSLMLIFAFAASSTQAQNPQITYLLDDSLSGSTKTYVARDEIVMKPGFVYSASGSNAFKAKIDAGLLFPPDSNTYALPNGQITTDPTQGAVVGSIPGQFAVSPTGAATYTIPIECPPGINGMQPNVSLVYNSQAGNGIAGWGWNLSGVSMISRVPKNHYYDGEKTGIIWDNTSPYALDGQRLIQTQSWGTDSVEYDTEARSGSRIVGYNIQSWGPSYFNIFTKSGQIITYGNPDNFASYYPVENNYSAIGRDEYYTLGWAITKVVDCNQNTLSYFYTHETTENIYFGDCINWIEDPEEGFYCGENELILNTKYSNNRLESITYGGNIAQNKENNIQILFLYNTISTSSVVQSFVHGKETTISKILNLINIVVDESTTNIYTINYSLFENKYRMTYVQHTNALNEHINSSAFEWSDNLYQYNFIKNSIYSTTTLIDSLQNAGYDDGLLRTKKFYGDIDGDGDLDMLVHYILLKVTPRIWPLTDKKEYKHLWVMYRNDNGVYSKLFEELYKTTENRDYRDPREFLFMDKDNDGKDELYIGNKSSGNYKFTCYKLTGSSFATYPAGDFFMPAHANYSNSETSIKIIPGDFLGKGEPQLLAINKTDDKVTPFSFSDSSVSINNIMDNVRSILVTDINGNGKSEIACVYDDYIRFYELSKQSSGIYTLTTISYCLLPADFRVIPADLNGDGNTDIIVQSSSSKKWSYYLSNGISLIYKDSIPGLPEKKSNSAIYYNFGGTYVLSVPLPVQIVDVNKDGKSDILFLERNANGDMQLKLVMNNGTSFSLKGDFTQTFSGSCSPDDFMHTGRFAGANGSDKYDDIVLIDFFGFSDPIFNISQGASFDKIQKIKSPFGSTTHVAYDVFNADKIKVFENGVSATASDDMRKCSYVNKGSWDVVSENYLKDNSNNEISRMKYYYGNAVIHKEGKGILGYESFAKHNTVTSIVEAIKYKLNESYYVLLPEISATLRHNTTDTISKNTSSYTFEARNGIPKSYNLKLNKQVSKDYLSSLETKVEYLNYDTWLNPLQIKTTKGGLIETQTITYTQENYWWKKKPQDITKVTTYDGQSETKKIEYYYDDISGNLIKEIVNPNNSEYKVTTEYKNFDAFGHPLTVEVKAKDAAGTEQTRKSSMTYTLSGTSKGRFMTSKTNVLDETTTYNWDETRGLLNSETTKNKTTYYTYDNFGRLKETKYPDGNRKTAVLQWAGGGGPAGAVYYSYAQISGSAPVTTWYDALGREIQKDTYGLYNQNVRKVSVSTEYYTSGTNKGRLYRVSEPYFEGDAKIWAETYSVYDSYGRPTTVTTLMGNVTTVYSGLNTTVTTPESTKTTVLNSSGFVASSTVNGKTVSYAYYPSGLTKTATPQGGQALSMEYNLHGKRTKLTDPDAGIIETKYNGFGELVEEKQKIHSNNFLVTSHQYEANTGRLNSINRNGEITSYSYDTQNRVDNIEIASQHKQKFTYDAFDRVTNIREEIGTQVLNRETEYDALGRVRKETYPSGYYTVNTYDNDYGFLTEVKDKYGRQIWKVNSENARGQITQVQRGGKTTTFGYDSRGLPDSIYAAGIVHMKYNFDTNVNLHYRIDKIAQQKEELLYDGMNRLTNWDVYQNNVLVKPNNMVYNTNTGTITSKSDLNNLTMLYGENGKPHALTGIQGVPANFPADSLNVTYTDFKKIKNLKEGNKHYILTYGIDDQRRKSEFKINGVTQKTKYYLGDYEEETDNLGNIKKIHYLSGGAILINTNGVETLYYGYADYQGNLIALANDAGTVVENGRFAYDPWGKRRNPTNWTQDDTRTSWIVSRGYTMHEHLDAFGIINMNGRVYDPLTASFFSPDPFVQAPENWLNYNRYSYVLNNPLKYTDPSGEVFGTIFGLISDLVDNIFVRTFNGEKWDWTQTQMGFKIDMGLFKTDPNKSGWGQAWELLSRFTWQLPQTLVGNLIVSTGNMFGKVNNVTYGYGVTAVDMGLDGGAITVGNYTAGPSGYTADWRDHLFVHEYGHYVQSQHWGPLYLFSVGIPSLQSAILQTSNPSSPRHHDRWFEADASYKAMSYFDKYYGSGKDGYTYRSPDYFDKNSFINRSYSPYINPRRGTTYQGGNHPISSKFHWTDILIYIPILGLIPAIFY